MKHVFITFIILVSLCAGTPAHAAETSNQGLYVAPSRQTLITKAGTSSTVHITVANKSTEPMMVELQSKQFAVDKKTQTIQLKTPEYDWLTARDTHEELAPAKSTTATYMLHVPKDAASGEYYFALLANTKLATGTSSKTVQVASLLYLYVDGGNMRRTSEIASSTIPTVVFGTSIPYSFDIKNTGNIHRQLKPMAKLNGLRWEAVAQQNEIIALPNQTRTITGNIPTPIFPGVYTFTYGYTDSLTKQSTTLTKHVVYVPFWSFALFGLILLIALWAWQRRHVRPTAV